MAQEKLSVSIIVPVYNVSLYVERCVKSVMAQTYPVKECILVDDASPDDSIAISERLIDSYDGEIKFLILHHPRNLGLSTARNTGLKAATGDYIYFLDSDDEITPDCIEKLAKPIERDSSIEMVVGNHQEFPDLPGLGHITLEEEFTSLAEVRNSFFDSYILPVMAWNKLISRHLLIDNSLFFGDGIIHEDILWSFYVVKYLQHLYVIPDTTYYYYLRPSSITTATGKQETAYHYSIIYEDIARNFTPGEESREARYYLDDYYRLFCKNLRMEGYIRALPFFENALATCGSRSERRRLWVLRHSAKSAFWHWTLFICMKAHALIRNPYLRIKQIQTR